MGTEKHPGKKTKRKPTEGHSGEIPPALVESILCSPSWTISFDEPSQIDTSVHVESHTPRPHRSNTPNLHLILKQDPDEYPQLLSGPKHPFLNWRTTIKIRVTPGWKLEDVKLKQTQIFFWLIQNTVGYSTL